MKSQLVTALAIGTVLGAQASTVFGPVPYTSAADNPVSGSFSYSLLETFEDNLLNTPGVIASGGSPLSSVASAQVDSVDADDGAIDGSGSGGHSYYSSGLTSVTFTFSALALGSLPTVVGIAFTDVGQLLVAGVPCCVADGRFEAFDDGGVSLGVVTLSAFGDGVVNGTTGEDRFVAMRNAGGISRIEVGFAASGDWEVDHLFYARDANGVPEPPVALLLGLGLLAAGAARRRR